MTDPTDRPLWEVMQDAYCGTNFTPEPLDAPLYAAELRAIAYEMHSQIAKRFPDISAQIAIDAAIHWLLAEADKAEVGE